MMLNSTIKSIFRTLSIVAIGCAVLGFGLTSACKKPEEPPKPIRPVRVMKIDDAERLTRRAYPGKARAADEVDLSFRVGGPLVAFPVDVGDRVEKGQVIAKIDPRDFEVNLRNIEGQVSRSRSELAAMQKGARAEDIAKMEAEVERTKAEVDNAELDLKRYRDLLAANAVAQIDVDRRELHLKQKKTELTQAQKELTIGRTGAREEDIAAKKSEITSLEASADATRDQLNYTILTAPFSGTIATKYVDNFQTVQVRQPVARLLDSTHIEMVIDIPENLISLVPHVKDCIVKYDAIPNKEVHAKIKEIGNEAKEATRTYPVTLTMEQPEDAKILPGMAGVAQAGEVDVASEKSEGGPVVPPTAVFSDKSGKSYVWIVAQPAMTVAKKEVGVGELTSLGMHLTGLTAGDLVVTAGVNHLAEGEKVSLLQDDKSEGEKPEGPKAVSSKPAQAKPEQAKVAKAEPEAAKPPEPKPEAPKPANPEPGAAKPPETKLEASKPANPEPENNPPAVAKPEDKKPASSKPSGPSTPKSAKAKQ